MAEIATFNDTLDAGLMTGGGGMGSQETSQVGLRPGILEGFMDNVRFKDS